MNKYYLLYNSITLLDEATDLSNFTHQIELLDDINNLPPNTTALGLDEYGLYLYSPEFKAIYIKNIYSQLYLRTQNLKNELLIKSIKKEKNGCILDLTAGLAKDAILIAKYGCNVIMLEQNPILATILYYAKLHNYIPNNCEVVFTNNINYIKQLPLDIQFDAIYLDPMFNQDKSAKAKKEMQIIQNIADTYIGNHDYLFNLAFNFTHKIIIKRSIKQPCLIDIPNPTYVIKGNTIRYDIYVR